MNELPPHELPPHDLPTVARSTDEPAVGASLGATSSTSAGASRRRWRRTAASPHASRFTTATAILVGLAIGAVVIAAALASGGRKDSSSEAWSAFTPPDSGTLGARDIANYLAPFYRNTPAAQLSVVTVINLESQAAAAAAEQASENGTTVSQSSGNGLQVAVRPSATSSAISLLTGNTIAYSLCGIGAQNCAIGAGKPSTNRLLLLRREALELALYTFKYIGGTQNVVAVLPPGRMQTTGTTGTLTKKLPTASSSSSSKPVDIAVLFERQELQPLLERPLSASLGDNGPPSVAEMSSAPEAALVSEVTARGLFSEQLQQTQDGSRLIVLDPLPPQ